MLSNFCGLWFSCNICSEVNLTMENLSGPFSFLYAPSTCLFCLIINPALVLGRN